MSLFNKHFWKFLGGFLILISLGVAALLVSTDYLSRNHAASEMLRLK